MKYFRNCKINGIVFFLVVFFAFQQIENARADHKLVINTASQPPWSNSKHTGFQDELIKEIFRRIGHDLIISFMQANARALVNVNTGIDDGNMLRVKGMEKTFKNMRMVPEPVISFEFVGFTRNRLIEIENWDDLAPYNVAFIRGWKIVEKNVRNARSINMVKNAGQLFNLLKNDRVDIVIFEQIRGRYILEKEGFDDVRALSPPLVAPEFFLYFNKKHEQIIPSIAAALRQIKADGSYRKIFDTAVGSLASEEEVNQMLSR